MSVTRGTVQMRGETHPLGGSELDSVVPLNLNQERNH